MDVIGEVAEGSEAFEGEMRGGARETAVDEVEVNFVGEDMVALGEIAKSLGVVSEEGGKNLDLR